MKNLQPISNSKYYFLRIALKKATPRNNILRVLYPIINARYQEYLDRLHPLSLETLTAFLGYSNVEKEALLHCYSNTKQLSFLLKSIQDKQTLQFKDLCPYCLVNSYSTFDHFVPKESFPDYSAMGHNLIPCCATCNSKKGDRWVDIDGRMFLNFYYDIIPTEQVLFCQTNTTGAITTAIFLVDNRNGIDPNLFNICDSHFEKLDLKRRYSRKSNSQIRLIEIMIRAGNFTSILAIQNFLRAQIIQLRIIFGTNYWEACLMESLINNTTFLTNLIV